jgi:hypothetical protein
MYICFVSIGVYNRLCIGILDFLVLFTVYGECVVCTNGCYAYMNFMGSCV